MYGKQIFASKIEIISGFIDSYADSSSCTMGSSTIDIVYSPHNFRNCNQTNPINNQSISSFTMTNYQLLQLNH